MATKSRQLTVSAKGYEVKIDEEIFNTIIQLAGRSVDELKAIVETAKDEQGLKDIERINSTLTSLVILVDDAFYNR